MPTEEEQAAAKAAAEAADKALEERVSKIVNSALTSHMKRVKPGLGAEELEKFLEDREAKRAAEAEEKKKAGGGADDKTAAERIAEKKRLEAIEKKLAEAEAKSAALEKRATEEQRRANMSGALEAAGVKGVQVRHALRYLEGEGLVKPNDDGQLVFVKRSGSGAEEEVEFAKGLADWMKTDDGKHFLPPSGAGGSGSGQGGKAGTSRAGSGADSKSRASAALSAFVGRGGE